MDWIQAGLMEAIRPIGGRLIREEAVDQPFHDFEPIPWSPTRISTFTYRGHQVEEALDSNADGVADAVMIYPVDSP
ncbi:MAG: hypothetical protein CMH52_11760 [Myxococcales bacterium]|nr:hypothetical protein [Myxococcales bacterium]|tara:strand:+ start:1459 stop:1686 length:228 start_codon:yes stop_codon:yes gene_type:complete